MNRSQAFDPLRALDGGWQVLNRAPAAMWFGACVLVLTQVVLDAGFEDSSDWSDWDEDQAARRLLLFLIPLTLLTGLITLIRMAVTAWLRDGLFRGVKRVVEGEQVRLVELFTLNSRWVRVFATQLIAMVLRALLGLPLILMAIQVLIGGFLMQLPGAVMAAAAVLFALIYLPVAVYLWLGLTLMIYPAAVDGLGPIQAARRSWELARGVRLRLLAMEIICFFLYLGGVCACVIGVIPAGALCEVMFCEAYVQATRPEEPQPTGLDDDESPV